MSVRKGIRLKNLRLIILVFVVAGSISDGYGQYGKAGSFLRTGLGARAKGMGDAFTGIAQGLEASFYNPAGLPFLVKKELFASYRFLTLDRQFTAIGFAMPIQPKIEGTGEKALNGGVAFAWIRAGVGEIDGRNTDGLHTNFLSNSENAFIFSFALNPAEGLSVGLVVKVLWNRFPGIVDGGGTISASGVGFDFGALYRPASWISIGVVTKDFNSKYRWNTEELYGEDGSETTDSFPRLVRLGVGVRPPQLRNTLLVADIEHIFDNKLFSDRLETCYHFGAEKIIGQVFAIRGGLDDGALTAGLGYSFKVAEKPLFLNYTFTTGRDRPEEEHVLTWIFQF
jgi:hypothetical protein